MSLKLEVMGHRGNKQFCELDLKDPKFIRENSIEAFTYSLITVPSCEYIETDLRLTKDKRVVIIHDNVLKRCYGIDHEKTIDEISFKELTEYGVPSFESFLNWFLNIYKKEKKIVLDIKSVVPLELLDYLEKEILEYVTNEKDLEIIKRNFILGLWTSKQVDYISNGRNLLKQLPKINITLSIPTFINDVYKNDFNFIGCSVHYISLWDSSNLQKLFDFIIKHKDVYNNENPFVLTIWTVNEKDIILQTLKSVREHIFKTPNFDGFNLLKIALCTDNPQLMNKLFIVDDIFNRNQYELKISRFSMYKKILLFNIISYALYSNWFSYEIKGYSFLYILRRISGI